MEPDAHPSVVGDPPLAPRRGFAQLARDSALYATGSITGKVVGLLLLPVVTRLLGPEDFGRLDVLSTMATAVTSVAVLGLDVAAIRLYPEWDSGKRRHLYPSWLAIVAVVLVPIVAVLVAGGGTISEALFGSDGFGLGIALVAIAVTGNLLQVVGLTALRSEARAVAYATASASAFVIGGVAVTVLASWQGGVNATMAGVAIGLGWGGLAALATAHRQFTAPPTRQAASALLRLGIPLLPAIIVVWVGEFVNRTILLSADGAEQVGYLSVALRFGAVGLLVVTGFQLAWHPRAFELGESPAALAQTALDGRRIVSGTALLILPLGILAPELVVLVGGETYEPARAAIGWALVQAIAFALFTVASLASVLAHRTRDVGVAASAGGLVGIGLNVLVAGTWGSAGTAAAVAIGQCLAAAGAAALGRRRLPLPLDWLRMLTVSVVTGSAVLLATLVDAPLVARIALGALVVMVMALEGTVAELWTFARGFIRRQRSLAPPR